jgi:hypothetical protein
LDPDNFTMDGLNWNEEPEVYRSSSSESKYSNEDKEYKDHLTTGIEAVKMGLKKYKYADKITQLNELKGKETSTSHMVTYLRKMNENGHVPRSLGMFRRAGDPSEIKAENYVISDPHGDAVSAAIGKAKFVTKVNVRSTKLDDKNGIKIL